MEIKPAEQIKPEIQSWPISNTFVGLLGLLAPAALLAILLGHSGLFLDFLINTDYSRTKGSKTTSSPRKSTFSLSRWLFSWAGYGPGSRRTGSRNADSVWRNGSLLCSLVNTAVPGACRNPQEHWMRPPEHGLRLVLEYFDIESIFSSSDLCEKSLTPNQECQFNKYLDTVHELISHHTEQTKNMKYSTDYVARGMGLVVAQQNRKSTFYVYPIPKHCQQPCDLEVTIKGPCGNKGRIVIPSVLHHHQKWQPPTEYKRSLYMSSKLNSISPTTQGSSFLRRLSLSPVDQSDLDVRVKVTSTRAKISYIPQKTGIYEISLVTKSCHVVGSPYSVPVETAMIPCNSNDSDEDSDKEQEDRYVKRKKKIISRIVDFIDEKMLVQNDGTLVKIVDEKVDKNVPVNNNSINLIPPDILEVPTKKSVPFINQINDPQINTQTDPTLDFKVQDPKMYKKTFSTKDPTKELIIKQEVHFLSLDLNNKVNEKSRIVNNLIHVFDRNKTEQIFESLQNNDMPVYLMDQNETINDPDLVKCHVEKNNNIYAENSSEIINEILQKCGVISSEYDKHQCDLKLYLNYDIHKFKNNNCAKEIRFFAKDNSGLVKKQKQFWQEKTDKYKDLKHIKTVLKPTKILKSSFIHDCIPETKKDQINDEYFKSFEGLVKNNRKIFENKINTSEIITCKQIKKVEYSFSCSESIIHERNVIRNLISEESEEIIKFPSVEERKEKLLKAYIKAANIKQKQINILKLAEQENTMTEPTKIKESITTESTEVSKPIEIQAQKISIRRKSRFKRAKLFFQKLESPTNPHRESSPNTNNKIPRSESDPCVPTDRTKTPQLNLKPIKISDRFQVDGLYQDILGDSDKRFIGIPNKSAVVACLASLDSAKNENIVDFDPQFEIDYFKETPKKKIQNRNYIPGFHGEYPHPPTTNSWRFRSRTNPDNIGLIPGRILLAKSMEDLTL